MAVETMEVEWMTAQSLPPLEQCGSLHPRTQDAYRMVLRAESEALAAGSDEATMNARVIGWLIVTLVDFRTFLKDGLIMHLSQEILSTDQDVSSLIYQLGRRYRHLLLRTFRRRGSGTPSRTPSAYPSRTSFATLQDMIDDVMHSSNKDHIGAKKLVRALALTRDGYRCMLAGSYDLSLVKINAELDMKIHQDTSARVSRTNCCHILIEPTLQGVDGSGTEVENKGDHPSAALAILTMCGLGHLVNSVFQEEGGVHHLSNILTLSTRYHPHFDKLEIWLEGTGQPNEYRICTFMEDLLYDLKQRVVKFQEYAEDGSANLPLPDPGLLAIHAVCARVAHLSGAAEYMDKIDTDIEDLRVLSADGSSALLLSERLDSLAAGTFASDRFTFTNRFD